MVMRFDIPAALCIMIIWVPTMRYFISYLITHPLEEQESWICRDTWAKALAISVLIGIIFPGTIIGTLIKAETFIDSGQDSTLVFNLVVIAAANIYCLVQVIRYKEVKNNTISTFGYILPIIIVISNIIGSCVFTI